MNGPVILTSIAAAIVVVLLVAVDVVFAVDGVRGNTWSEVIRMWGQRYALIPWAWGMLAGHFFHPSSWWSLSTGRGIPVLLWCAAVTQIVSMAHPGYVPMLAYLVVGVLVGVICWPC